MSAGYLRKCVGKISHPEKEGAESHRRRMVAAGKWTLTGSNTYRCTYCGGYHAGRKGMKYRGKG